MVVLDLLLFYYMTYSVDLNHWRAYSSSRPQCSTFISTLFAKEIISLGALSQSQKLITGHVFIFNTYKQQHNTKLHWPLISRQYKQYIGIIIALV